MKNILFYGIAALWFLFHTEAAENPPMENSIPFHVINETWSKKTALEGIVTYINKEEKKFFLILDDVTKLPIQKSIGLPHGDIVKIGFYLHNYYHDNEYYYDDDGKQLKGTLIATTVFEPSYSSLKEITFTINGHKIIAQPTYLEPASLP